ncbi:hypothetical protein [Marinobacter sp. SS21]|uniref:hypothetical protein n=1 Tax=Marinobacter sp. SS21 TaxID=2979460 RepID=UPI00232D7131|nr:hypothetical protein [Marinobacter sp. SS21]MDC0663127.1 hypothetical protein [Marinobacter sp. SS21]
MDDSIRLNLRYKIAKLLKLFPQKKKRQLSEFEDLGLRARFYDALWQQAAEALELSFEKLGYGFWQASNGQGHWVRGNVSGIDLDRRISSVLSGNKPLTHRLLADIPGYRAPRYQEYTLASIDRAQTFMIEQSAACVVKPAADTGAGSGVSTDVTTRRALETASIEAAVWSKHLLIEETIPGHSFRLLVLNDRLIHAVRRDPPMVTGDGRSRIEDLIEQENRRRMSNGKVVSLFPIQIDFECRQSLAKQSLRLSSVPAAGQRVRVKDVVNQNAAEQNVDVTDLVHPDIAKLAITASRHMGLSFCGVDVIADDISVPLSQSGGVINELNAHPGLHHHYLTSAPDKPPVAEQLMAYCLARHKQKDT